MVTISQGLKSLAITKNAVSTIGTWTGDTLVALFASSYNGTQ